MKSGIAVWALAVYMGIPVAAAADEARELFVESNILAIFYHELGHAVIDLMEVPIFGQEEDAADVMSVLLIDQLFTEETAQIIAHDSAFGFLSPPDELGEIAWWSLHGQDEQRFYNHVCLFFGGNPDERDDLAIDLGLPEERAETCPEEYDMAAESWGLIFDEMGRDGQGVAMQFVPGQGVDSKLLNRVLDEEVASISAELPLPERVTVYSDTCDEANAFYDPEDRSVTFCIEFIDHLRTIYDSNFE